MKNTFFSAALLALAFGAQAQSSTVDSIAAKYKLLPMPQAWTIEKTFPVLGQYQLAGSADSAATVAVTLDSVNKGIVWISGLPQGNVKAYLVKSPSTYRIVPQKSASGRTVPEGTVLFTPETNTLQIALGAPFNAENPTAIFPVTEPATAASADLATSPTTATVKIKTESSKGKVKSKSKVTYYTATKLEPATTASSNVVVPQETPVQQAPQQQ